MPRPGLASRFIVCCFLGPGGFGWKSSIFTGWASGWTGGRRALCRERQRSRVSAEELESSKAQGSRVTQWCRSQAGVRLGASGRAARVGCVGRARCGYRWRRRKHLAEEHRAGKGCVRAGWCVSSRRLRRAGRKGVARRRAENGAKGAGGVRRHADARVPEGRAAAPAGGTGAREACVGAPGAAVCESTRLSCRIDWLLGVAGAPLNKC